MELYPDVFSGGLLMSGGGAGEIAVLNNKLNALFALKTLVDPSSPLKLVNIDNRAEQAALDALLKRALATPLGRARLALAAGLEQFAPWSSRSKPKPAPTDYEAQLDQMAESFVFATAIPVRAGVEKAAGGNVSWNTGVDYAAVLRGSGRQTMVEALYKRAGASLADDLTTLAKAPRIAASPSAVRRAEAMMTYTGRIYGPIVNVDNDDPVDPASDKLAYVKTLQRAGTAANFRLIWADGPGHGGQTNLDRAIGFSTLIRRLDSGRWPDTSVRALKAAGADIAKASPVDLGQSTVFDPGKLPHPGGDWDVTRWGSYRR